MSQVRAYSLNVRERVVRAVGSGSFEKNSPVEIVTVEKEQRQEREVPPHQATALPLISFLSRCVARYFPEPSREQGFG